MAYSGWKERYFYYILISGKCNFRIYMKEDIKCQDKKNAGFIIKFSGSRHSKQTGSGARRNLFLDNITLIQDFNQNLIVEQCGHYFPYQQFFSVWFGSFSVYPTVYQLDWTSVSNVHVSILHNCKNSITKYVYNSYKYIVFIIP